MTTTNQRTLDQNFVMPPTKPRQFAAITYKNWLLLAQGYGGMIACALVATGLIGLMGWLHAFYLSTYKPSDNNGTAMNPVPMPIESQPTDINHHILFTLQPSVSAASRKHFGSLPENASTQCKGFLGKAADPWSETGSPQLRVEWPIPPGANTTLTKAAIPFATVEDLTCTEPDCYKYRSFQDVDYAVNATNYQLMALDIDIEHKKNKTHNITNTQKIVNALTKPFQPKYHEVYDKVSKDELEFNATSDFLFNKHSLLFTAAVNYSYLEYPYGGALGHSVEEAGWDYIISTYTSHQTEMNYDRTNFFHIGGTQHMLWQTFIRNAFENQASSEPPLVKGFYKQFWENYADNGPDPFTPIFVCLFIPIAFYLVVPMFSYQMSQEKGDGLLSLEQMMGLRYFPRFFGDLLYQLIISAALYGIIIGGAAIGGLQFVSSTYWPIWLLSTLLFMLSIPVMSQFVSSFTDSGRISSILCILVVLVEAIVGMKWTSSNYGADNTNRTIDMWYAAIPGMAPVVCLSMINSLILTQNPNNYLSDGTYFKLVMNPDGSMTAAVGHEIAGALVIGYISLIVYSLISVYVDRITPRRNGIPEHPLFFLQSTYERACVSAKISFQEITWGKAFWALGQVMMRPAMMLISQQEIDAFVSQERGKNDRDADREDDESDHPSSTTNTSTTFDYLKGQKDGTQTSSQFNTERSQPSQDVAARQIQKQFKQANKLSQFDEDLENERRLTVQGLAASNGQKPLVRLLNLKKTYPATKYTPAKQAVRGVYYTVGENECLCLLGANGCGKTTQINMLCMLFKPTSGTAYVCGKSVTDRRSQQFIQANLGVCPQFDILYPTMNIRQHLKFYAMIKGISTKIEKEHIDDLLEAVELTIHQKQASKKLSGGMKRRLSISIALCCKPKVLIFDEPSSGLDVATRRQLWNVIIKARQGRAVLLTTHAMEEAECLSTRIAIMAEGKIRCIGTVSHLQQKFGSGYQLSISVDKERVIKADPIYVGSVYLATKNEQLAHGRISRDVGQNLVLASCYQGNLTYVVPEGTIVSQLFAKMESVVSDKDSGICDWGLNQTSLESVFMKVVSQSY